ncbi:hypothetical protein T03_17331 [Trichinella britovi]|uniref:Uncharacterized protein n=1 Tax=Trichinella britovi TaxID=45882 RepID=A0A0V1D181_TRIBR|nr:hypothetical protein T03_17331 [Trichinella britovi]
MMESYTSLEMRIQIQFHDESSQRKANICTHFSYRPYSDDNGIFDLRIFVCIEPTREMRHFVPRFLPEMQQNLFKLTFIRYECNFGDFNQFSFMMANFLQSMGEGINSRCSARSITVKYKRMRRSQIGMTVESRRLAPSDTLLASSRL